MSITRSTLYAVLAEVSKNSNSCFYAKSYPSSYETTLFYAKSVLFPTNIIVIFSLAYVFVSSNHLIKLSYDSRFVTS